MKNIATVKKSTYFDSVTLMGVSKRLEKQEGIVKVSVSMGTELNQGLLREAGLNTPETDAAGPNDLMIVVVCEDNHDEAEILRLVEDALTRREAADAAHEADPATIRTALHRTPDANLALISVPGVYAGFEAKRALQAGLNVMIFSDNVSVEEEVALKKLAHEKGLLVMGPDCGTAVINGVGLAFANGLRRGEVGVVGASGTGMQEVTALLDCAGVGISQAIGTGGRDLSDAVGGVMTADALSMLAADEQTKVLVVIAKSCAGKAAQKISATLANIEKPTVLCFLESGARVVAAGNVVVVETLEDAAREAARLAGADFDVENEAVLFNEAAQSLSDLAETQRYVRGIFCGGTLANECRKIFKKACPQASVFSNIAHEADEKYDGTQVKADLFLDMGDDEFTVGRAHPMIDPSIRNDRVLAEATNENVGVVLFDVVLGYGAARDPLDGLTQAIETAQAAVKEQGRHVIFLAHVLGTDSDPQSRTAVVDVLRKLGVIVAATNAQAARLCARLKKEMDK